ncbi:MAG: prepilin peptidase [Pseudomonadota bacterium]
MTVTSISAVLASIVFLGAMAVVIYTDLKTRQIQNKLILLLLGLYVPMVIAAGGNAEVILFGVLAAIPVLILGFVCFTFGWMGGGDAKLMPVSVLWLGPALGVPYLLIGAVVGSLLTLGILAYRRRFAPTDGKSMPLDAEVPYGPALALSGAVMFLQSWWVAQI